MFYNTGKHKLRYSFVSMGWKGEKTTTKTLLFSGKTYLATAFVQTELDIDCHRLGYEYAIIDKDKYNVGFIFEIKYFGMLVSGLKGPGWMSPSLLAFICQRLV